MKKLVLTVQVEGHSQYEKLLQGIEEFKRHAPQVSNGHTFITLNGNITITIPHESLTMPTDTIIVTWRVEDDSE